MNSSGFFGLCDHLEKLSQNGPTLEALVATVDFEYLRSRLVMGYGDGSKGGCQPFDPVSMFKALIVQARHNLSAARMAFMIRDRLLWMRLVGFELRGALPDENTIQHFRNRVSDTDNTAADVWADSAYRWQHNDKWLELYASAQSGHKTDVGSNQTGEC